MASELTKNPINNILTNQCVSSGCSVGANYKEANDALGDKDFLFRLGIPRKEAKETIYWIELIIDTNSFFPQKTSRTTIG